MAGDTVKFNPEALDGLSKELSKLANVLESGLPRIKKIVAAEGGHLTGRIPEWIAKTRDDANDMAYRVKRAHQADGQGKWPERGCVAPPRMIALDWDDTGSSGTQAKQDATDVAKAMRNPNTPVSRRDLKAALRSLRDHGNDGAYRRAFWGQIRAEDPALTAKIIRCGTVAPKPWNWCEIKPPGTRPPGWCGTTTPEPPGWCGTVTPPDTKPPGWCGTAPLRGMPPIDQETQKLLQELAKHYAAAAKAGDLPGKEA